MKKALINRIRIFTLEMTLYERIKLFVWSIAMLIYKYLKISIPAIRVNMKKYGSMFISDGTDLGTFMEVFSEQEYRIPPISIPVKRVLDLGANSGYTSIYFAQHFPEAEIVAVEADPVNVDKARMSFKEHGDLIIVEPSAISDNIGYTDFYLNFETSISGSMMMRDLNAKKIQVPTVTLASLEKVYGSFDVIKFDIEGGEWVSILPDTLVSQPCLYIGEYHSDLVGKPESEFLARFKGYSVISRKLGAKRSLVTLTR